MILTVWMAHRPT